MLALKLEYKPAKCTQLSENVFITSVFFRVRTWEGSMNVCSSGLAGRTWDYP